MSVSFKFPGGEEKLVGGRGRIILAAAGYINRPDTELLLSLYPAFGQ